MIRHSMAVGSFNYLLKNKTDNMKTLLRFSPFYIPIILVRIKTNSFRTRTGPNE